MKKVTKKVVEIDQSGRVEDLTCGTAVAFSNGNKRAVFVSAGTKREVVKILKSSIFYRTNYAPLFFALLIFLLIKDEQLTSVKIDEEYTGKENYILEVLVGFFKKDQTVGPKFVFARIGKRSPAHAHAIEVFRAKGRGVAVRVALKEIMAVLDKKLAGTDRHTHRVSR